LSIACAPEPACIRAWPCATRPRALTRA
jgi:hypothetical protein